MNIAVLSCMNIKNETCLGHKDTIIEKVKAKAGVDVIEGTHPYRPDQVFGN